MEAWSQNCRLGRFWCLTSAKDNPLKGGTIHELGYYNSA
jgi:hypothetical protein